MWSLLPSVLRSIGLSASLCVYDISFIIFITCSLIKYILILDTIHIDFLLVTPTWTPLWIVCHWRLSSWLNYHHCRFFVCLFVFCLFVCFFIFFLTWNHCFVVILTFWRFGWIRKACEILWDTGRSCPCFRVDSPCHTALHDMSKPQKIHGLASPMLGQLICEP